MLAVRLPEDLDKRLSELAKRSGRTKAFYAREAILRYLEDMENFEDAYLAAKRLKSPHIRWTSDELENFFPLSA